jgi:uncharacterized protein (DUF2267 family)
MYVKVRVRLKTGEAKTIRAELPNNLKDYSQDTINDAVSDWLDNNGVDCKWYRTKPLK